MKKILIITPYFAPAWGYGGPPKALYEYAKELVILGYNVTVITTDALDENRYAIYEEKMNGIKILRMKNISNYLAYHYKIFYIPIFLPKIKRKIEESDCILFSDLRPIMHWQIISYVQKKNIPYGIFPFGQIPYDRGLKSLIKRLFDLLWVRNFVCHAGLRFAQTQHEKDMYHALFGIDVHQTQFLPLPVHIQKKIFISSEHKRPDKKYFQLLFIGRFHYLKGIDLLLDAVLPLIEKNKKIKLILIGRDDGYKSFMQRIPQHLLNNVIVPGSLYKEKLHKWLQQASCFIISPRYFEETPLAGLEALAFGIPAIVTHEASIPFLEDYGAGYEIDNDKQSIQLAIQKMYDRWKANPRSLRKNALKLVAEKYSAKIIGKKISEYLNSAFFANSDLRND